MKQILRFDLDGSLDELTPTPQGILRVNANLTSVRIPKRLTDAIWQKTFFQAHFLGIPFDPGSL